MMANGILKFIQRLTEASGLSANETALYSKSDGNIYKKAYGQDEILIPAGGVWKNYTPIWTAATTNPSIGNGTLAGRYTTIGKLAVVSIRMVAGSTTTFGSDEWRFSLPIVSQFPYGSFPVKVLDYGTAWYDLTGKFASNSLVYIPPLRSTYPMTWAVNDFLELTVTYEI